MTHDVRQQALAAQTPHPYAYHVRQKQLKFYFCNSFVSTPSITTIFGTHILQ